MGLIGGRGLYDANKNSRELASAIFGGKRWNMDGAQAGTDSVTVSSEEQRPASNYFSLLNYTAKKRYLEKLKKGNFSVENLFSIDNSQWSQDLSQWPELEFGDIYSYL